ncbi:DUF4974 domain-containing protein [Chitinophaga agrisoli]|uniref:DUF4974 domain-containing protein n=1 Tax=Chitinophaga agrisoli TaxID=2607653 RepID=A0A5B2VNK7_9BACT|nr:DUF4974 domain-containing protein [Chitinophaga agrisoli]KAA2239892.1 DUF4974 domain-containing protein [Chitinophaga agrisoli]
MLPQVTMLPFDADEFLELLLRQQAGFTSRWENDYIRRTLQDNPMAQQLLAAARETFPNEEFAIVPKQSNRKMICYASIFMLLVVSSGLFSMWYQNYRTSTVQPATKEYLFRAVTLTELGLIIQAQYGVQVKIDSREIAEQHFSGVINDKQSLQHLLEDITRSGRIRYYFDSTGAVHLR